jgi:hypothetical protein
MFRIELASAAEMGSNTRVDSGALADGIHGLVATANNTGTSLVLLDIEDVTTPSTGNLKL